MSESEKPEKKSLNIKQIRAKAIGIINNTDATVEEKLRAYANIFVELCDRFVEVSEVTLKGAMEFQGRLGQLEAALDTLTGGAQPRGADAGGDAVGEDLPDQNVVEPPAAAASDGLPPAVAAEMERSIAAARAAEAASETQPQAQPAAPAGAKRVATPPSAKAAKGKALGAPVAE